MAGTGMSNRSVNIWLRIAAVIVFLSTLSIFFLVFSLSFPSNPIKNRLPFDSKLIGSILLPEGWSFFTRNPREEWLFAYTLKNAKVEPILFKGSSSKNLFGFSKEFRIRNMEIHTILEKANVPENQWYICKDGFLNCHSEIITSNMED